MAKPVATSAVAVDVMVVVTVDVTVDVVAAIAVRVVTAESSPAFDFRRITRIVRVILV